MRKKLLVLGLAAIVGAASVPTGYMLSKAPVVASAEENDDNDDDAEAWEDDEDDSGELTKGDILASPAKKTIKVGKSFYITLHPSDECDSEYADLPDEEWDELVDQNIDSITFRSTKSSVASVNGKGKVKGKKKGSAIIKTTVTFRDGSEGIYRTKVYVTR